MYDVVIIGAGAAGCLCAINLKIKNKKLNVLMLEGNDKLGKKILMTGNGRCNLGNKNKSLDCYYSSSSLKPFEETLLSDDYLRVLNDLGIVIKAEEERLYPNTKEALTICKHFEMMIKSQKIQIKYGYKVHKVVKKDGNYVINDDLKAKTIVVAAGGKSYPKTGSDGTGLNLLRDLSHTIVKPYPSLTYLKTNYKYMKIIDGVRFDGMVSLFIDGVFKKEEKGQVQFTKNYVSGICVFNLSRDVKRFLEEGKKVSLVINFGAPYSALKIMSYLKKFSFLKTRDALCGIINSKLSLAVLKSLNLDDKIIASLKENELEKIANEVCEMRFNITGTGDFEASQVTAGGALLSEFNNDFESKINKNLYAIGEVLDVDAKCGGYNLAFAFSSAICASNAIARKYN